MAGEACGTAGDGAGTAGGSGGLVGAAPLPNDTGLIPELDISSI